MADMKPVIKPRRRISKRALRGLLAEGRRLQAELKNRLEPLRNIPPEEWSRRLVATKGDR